MLHSLLYNPKIFNKDLTDYQAKLAQDAIRKTIEQYNKERKVYIRHVMPLPVPLLLPMPTYNGIIATISSPPDDTPPHPILYMMSAACILSISSALFYFYRRK